MKLSLSWLKQHLDTSASLDEICTTLTAIGLEVEGVDDAGAALMPFTVCHVLEAKQHPNADRLRVCRVATKFGEVQVVCGAPNARTGLKAVFAPEGSVIPATGDVLKAGEIRGEKSCGMMVSEREMGLSNEHNGIIEAPEDAEIGTPLPELLGLNDPVIEINLTPNRGDCAGVRGVARDLAAAGLGTLKPLPAPPVPASIPSDIAITVEDSSACPLFIGRVIKGVKNGTSPKWMQDALKSIGQRPISALVDITNYFTFNLGRPLHVFDLDKLSGNRLAVRAAKVGETFHALDDQTYALEEGMIVLADAKGVQALGGVMGGAATGCTETTTAVLLEVAQFDPVHVAHAGRILGIQSDARYRFERGIDASAMPDYAELATRMILDLCGDEKSAASEVIILGRVPQPEDRRSIPFTPERTRTLGGVDVPRDEQEKILSTLGFEIQGDTLLVPHWRGDIDGTADIVEEVLRIKGFDTIPTLSLPRISDVASRALSPAQRRISQARRVAASRGLQECVNYTFIPRKHAELFTEGRAIDPSLEVVNPISSDMTTMRPSLMPCLLATAARNTARGYASVSLFEGGAIFSSAEKDCQINALATLRVGEASARHVHKGERIWDVFDAKADALALLEALGMGGAQITSGDAPRSYHPGRSGCLRLGKVVIGHFGELHPETIKAFDLKGTAVSCELFVDRIPLPKEKGTARPHFVLPTLQPLSRDFAFVVDEETPAEKVIRAVQGADRALIIGVSLFDDYRGKGLEAGKKSLALSVTLQPSDKTLTDKDIEAISQKIIYAVTKATGAVLRG